jgi:hypothetical protein
MLIGVLGLLIGACHSIPSRTRGGTTTSWGQIVAIAKQLFWLPRLVLCLSNPESDDADDGSADGPLISPRWALAASLAISVSGVREITAKTADFICNLWSLE